MVSGKTLISLIIIVSFFAMAGHAQSQTNLQGRIISAQSGTPVSGIEVQISGSSLTAVTNEQGFFNFQGLDKTAIELLIYAPKLTRQKVTLLSEQTNMVEFKVDQAPSPITESLTITAATTIAAVNDSAVEHTLNKPQLTALSSGIMTDPMRAAQTMPGVASNDDMSNRINIRGAGMQRAGFYIDGILTNVPTHEVNEEQGGGSASSLNMENIGGITLISGNYPAEFGESTAGVLSFDLRDGKRDQAGFRIASNALNSSVVAEGPLANQTGSWLVTARRSYMNYILQRLDRPGIVFDFSDIQGRVVRDTNAQNQLSFTFILGTTQVNQKENARKLSLNELLDSKSKSSLFIGRWSTSFSARSSLQTRLFYSQADLTNHNVTGLTVEEGERIQAGIRSDLYLHVNSSHSLQSGIYLRTSQAQHNKGIQLDILDTALLPLINYRQPTRYRGYYLQDTWHRPQSRFSISSGIRFETTNREKGSTITPRVSFGFSPLKNTVLRVGISQHKQFPDVEYLYGLHGNPKLKAESATHYNFTIERELMNQASVNAEFYKRNDTNLIFGLDDELQLSGFTPTGKYSRSNSMKGNIYGFEITVKRINPKRYDGWFSYSHLHSNYRDQASGLEFVSDYDQRHTISAFSSYQISNSLDTNFLWRYGSGMPLIGFQPPINTTSLLLGKRNTLRLPYYSRLDLRINKHFKFDHFKLKLTGELLNALARQNVRQVKTGVQPLFPFVPSGGVTIDF